MSSRSVAGVGEKVTAKKPRACAKCGAKPRRLMMDSPAHLSYEEKKEYKGEWYCPSHLPEFESLPTKSFGAVL
jgi:hypothetical protein